jgi:type VI secretion system protein ImpA
MSPQWESQELLQPISDEQPCGENLEDTPLLASFDTFRVFGQAMPLDPTPERPRVAREGEKPPAPIEWGEVRARALEALGRSKDLRLLVYLGAASLRTDGVGPFSRTLEVAAHWLQSYWAQTYPLIDEDAMLRRNALNCFADPMAVVEAVRRTPLVRSRQHGTFSLRDIDVATGQTPPAPGETPADVQRIDAAFSDTPLDQLEALQQSVASALSSLKAIDATMSEQGGPEAQPEFGPLITQFGKIDRVVRPRIAARTGPADGDAAAGDTAAGNGQPVATVGVGAIRSRQDAIRALDAVSEFFKANEPSSPVPLLIDRAKRLVAKNFLEVLADLAPDALGQARSAAGVQEESSA